MENTDFLRQDASLPAQYWKTFAKHSELAPEKRLLVAVLEEAVKSYRTLMLGGGRRFAEVNEWIFSDDNQHAFSFRNICDVLGLSPSRVRQSLGASAAASNRPAVRPPLPRRRSTGQRAEKAPPVSAEVVRRAPSGYTLAP
ncbi:MAG TPA: hypothetical protein VL754_01335 [Verrucomicrobiae bacterium]|jgi:hypothetical protein|nr:hypothetical protein [Verrucomicrobiae bacterium]